MRKMVCCILLYLSAITFANAQSKVSGIVFARTSRAPIDKVDVLNINTNETTRSNTKGEFEIKAKLNDVLVFTMPGYRSDTLLLINTKPLRRYLAIETNTLNTVTVNSKSLREQYAQTFNKANAVLLKQGRGLLFYPSAYFSREGKQARRLKRMIKQDEIELQINKRYNVKTVTAILPIKQPQLDAFMLRYRPTLKFIQRADASDFKSYLLDAYKQFKLLPADQRVLPSLRIDSLN